MDLIDLNCTNCDLCQTRTHVVAGEGPLDAPIMWVGEGPGEWEDKYGKPFYEYAKTGMEISWLWARHGFLRPLQYITNLVKCRVPNNGNPKPYQIEACSNWLDKEVKHVNPGIIVAIGHFSTNYFLPGSTLETVHGIPFEKDGRVIIPIYHPAAGFHKPDVMMRIHLDFRTVAEIVKGKLPTRHMEDEYAGKEEYYVLGDRDLL